MKSSSFILDIEEAPTAKTLLTKQIEESFVPEQTPEQIISMILTKTKKTPAGDKRQNKNVRNPDDLLKMIELVSEHTPYKVLEGTTAVAEYAELVKLALGLIVKGMTNPELAEVILKTHKETTDPSVRTANLETLYNK